MAIKELHKRTGYSAVAEYLREHKKATSGELQDVLMKLPASRATARCYVGRLARVGAIERRGGFYYLVEY